MCNKTIGVGVMGRGLEFQLSSEGGSTNSYKLMTNTQHPPINIWLPWYLALIREGIIMTEALNADIMPLIKCATMWDVIVGC